jgi:hypothetical protein
MARPGAGRLPAPATVTHDADCSRLGRQPGVQVAVTVSDQPSLSDRAAAYAVTLWWSVQRLASSAARLRVTITEWATPAGAALRLLAAATVRCTVGLEQEGVVGGSMSAGVGVTVMVPLARAPAAFVFLRPLRVELETAPRLRTNPRQRSTRSDSPRVPASSPSPTVRRGRRLGGLGFLGPSHSNGSSFPCPVRAAFSVPSCSEPELTVCSSSKERSPRQFLSGNHKERVKCWTLRVRERKNSDSEPGLRPGSWRRPVGTNVKLG